METVANDSGALFIKGTGLWLESAIEQLILDHRRIEVGIARVSARQILAHRAVGRQEQHARHVLTVRAELFLQPRSGLVLVLMHHHELGGRARNGGLLE